MNTLVTAAQPGQKPVCYSGLLVGGRQGCSQQSQDQADITPVDFDPSRPEIPPRVHSGERRSHLLALVHQKPVCSGLSSGGLLVVDRRGCSQQSQDQAKIAPSTLGRLSRPVPPRVHSGERHLSAPLLPNPIWSGVVCWSGSGRRPISKLRVGRGSYTTSGHFGSKRVEYWASLPATIEKNFFSSFVRDLSHPLLGCWRAPEITAMSLDRGQKTRDV